MSELAVKGCKFTASIQAGTISASLSEDPSVQPSNVNLVNNKGIYFDKVTAIVPSGSTVTLLTPPAGATSPTGTLITADKIDISGTADNILDANSKKAVQKNDNGSKSISFTFPAPNGATVAYSVTVKATVTDTGQTDVTAL